MIPCYNPMQLSEENLAIHVSFTPLKTLSNSDGYFSGYTIFYHDKYINKFFLDSVNKTNKNQDFRKGNGFFLIQGPLCGWRRPFQNCTEQPAMAVVGSNGLKLDDVLLVCTKQLP